MFLSLKNTAKETLKWEYGQCVELALYLSSTYPSWTRAVYLVWAIGTGYSSQILGKTTHTLKNNIHLHRLSVEPCSQLIVFVIIYKSLYGMVHIIYGRLQ